MSNSGKYILKSELAYNMRRRYINKMINLDQETIDLADKKPNFSAWVRNQLRSERNKHENDDSLKANTARKISEVMDISTAELLYHLEQRSDEEITALVSILRAGLNL